MGKKQKSGKKFSGLQNGVIRELQIKAGFRDYKSGQERLQRGAAFGVSNRGKKITNRGKEISHFLINHISITNQRWVSKGFNLMIYDFSQKVRQGKF